MGTQTASRQRIERAIQLARTDYVDRTDEELHDLASYKMTTASTTHNLKEGSREWEAYKRELIRLMDNNARLFRKTEDGTLRPVGRKS